MNRIARLIVLRMLRGIRGGALTIVEGSERLTFGELTELRVTLEVHCCVAASGCASHTWMASGSAPISSR